MRRRSRPTASEAQAVLHCSSRHAERNEASELIHFRRRRHPAQSIQRVMQREASKGFRRAKHPTRHAEQESAIAIDGPLELIHFRRRIRVQMLRLRFATALHDGFAERSTQRVMQSEAKHLSSYTFAEGYEFRCFASASLWLCMTVLHAHWTFHKKIRLNHH